MPTECYDIGDLRRLTAAFTVGGAPADPDAGTVMFTMLEPDGVKTVYTHPANAQIVKDGLGNYHVDWIVAKPGRHAYRWTGAGAAHAAEPGDFYARRKETG